MRLKKNIYHANESTVRRACSPSSHPLYVPHVFPGGEVSPPFPPLLSSRCCSQRLPSPPICPGKKQPGQKENTAPPRLGGLLIPHSTNKNHYAERAPFFFEPSTVTSPRAASLVRKTARKLSLPPVSTFGRDTCCLSISKRAKSKGESASNSNGGGFDLKNRKKKGYPYRLRLFIPLGRKSG